MEGLKSGGVGGSSCSSREDEYWRDSPSLLPEFVHKRGIFVGFLLVFCWILSAANRSLVYVNSINCILMLGLGW